MKDPKYFCHNRLVTEREKEKRKKYDQPKPFYLALQETSH